MSRTLTDARSVEHGDSRAGLGKADKERAFPERGCGLEPELDPRRGRMPRTRIGSERISVMRRSGPIGGNYAGSGTHLREWTGYSVFKKNATPGPRMGS